MPLIGVISGIGLAIMVFIFQMAPGLISVVTSCIIGYFWAQVIICQPEYLPIDS